jgi:hypothetical protein
MLSVICAECRLCCVENKPFMLSVVMPSVVVPWYWPSLSTDLLNYFLFKVSKAVGAYEQMNKVSKNKKNNLSNDVPPPTDLLGCH